MHDKELSELIKSDRQYFALLYDQYYVPIKKYILRRVGDYDISSDIAAETFLKAYLKVTNFTYRGISYKVWLFRIATNEMNLYFRKKKYKAQTIESLSYFNNLALQTTQQEEKDKWAQELQAHQDFITAQNIIRQLPLKYGEVLSLRYFEKMPIKEISIILNKPEGTIKSLCLRGLEIVRKKMQPK